MTDEEKEGESYTYGQRICKVGIQKYINKLSTSIIIDNVYDIISNNSHNNSHKHFINQMELMINTYKNKGYRNNQMILQIGEPSDMLLNWRTFRYASERSTMFKTY